MRSPKCLWNPFSRIRNRFDRFKNWAWLLRKNWPGSKIYNHREAMKKRQNASDKQHLTRLQNGLWFKSNEPNEFHFRKADVKLHFLSRMNNTGRLNCWVEFLFVNVNRVSHKTERLCLGLRISPQLRKSKPDFVLKIEESRRKGNGSVVNYMSCVVVPICSDYPCGMPPSYILQQTQLAPLFTHCVSKIPSPCLFHFIVSEKKSQWIFQELFFWVTRS